MVVLREQSTEKGFTLIETLIALLILAIVSLSILAMFTQAIELNATGRDHQTITNLARDQLEELLALSYTDALLNPGTTTESPPPMDDVARFWTVTAFQINESADTPITALATPVTTGIGNIKLITVTASAQNAFGFGDRAITVDALKRIDF